MSRGNLLIRKKIGGATDRKGFPGVGLVDTNKYGRFRYYLKVEPLERPVAGRTERLRTDRPFRPEPSSDGARRVQGNHPARPPVRLAPAEFRTARLTDPPRSSAFVARCQ